MSTIAEKLKYQPIAVETTKTAIEHDFPIVEISQIAEQESWRKEVNRPIYHIHKWWATRLGSVFRAITIAALSKPSFDTWKGFYELHRLAGKVVLDPFMGSGTTLGETIKLEANMVISLHPTVHGKTAWGYPLNQCFLITESGPQPLTKTPQEIIVV